MPSFYSSADIGPVHGSRTTRPNRAHAEAVGTNEGNKKVDTGLPSDSEVMLMAARGYADLTMMNCDQGGA